MQQANHYGIVNKTLLTHSNTLGAYNHIIETFSFEKKGGYFQILLRLDYITFKGLCWT